MVQCPLINTLTMFEIVHRQIVMKKGGSRSWVLQTQATLRKYGLDHIISIMHEPPSKEAWKEKIHKAIATFWSKKIQEEASEYSSLRFLPHSFNPNSPHTVWESTTTDPYDVRRATIKARILSGSYILQYNRAAFNQTTNTICP